VLRRGGDRRHAGVDLVQTPSRLRRPRIADRLLAAQRAHFVGREEELELFRGAVAADQPPFTVLHVHGPGGIGKTTLVKEYARIARDAGRAVVRLDARGVDPVPHAFMAALGQALGIEPTESPVAHWPHDGVLLIDTYEALTELDAWLRETLLPQLAAQTLVVIAGRLRPATAWTADIEWAPLTRTVGLRNLRPEESHAYLATRGVPRARHDDVLAATYGHPLALCLAADTFARDGESADFAVGQTPDVVGVLLERFARDVPSSQHRLALDACATVTAVTEPLLAAALAVDDAHDLFAWLGQLSFIERGPHGLFPHDLAREVLYADSCWRNPEMRRTLNERLLLRLYDKLQQARGLDQQRIWFDIIYVQRYNPGLRPYFAWKSFGSAYAEPARPEDVEPIADIVRRHEGAASEAIARHWLRRQPDAFLSFRDPRGGLIGFMAQLRLEDATDEDARVDPALPAVQGFMSRHGQARAGEEVCFARFYMGRDTYQAPSPTFNLLAANSSLYWTSHPKLAWSFAAVAEPDLIAPMFTSIHFWRARDADFDVGGRRYGVFAHDWRVEPIAAWLKAKVERASCRELVREPAEPVAPLLVLSQADFAEAVRQALRDFSRPGRLETNPLLRTRLVVEEPGPAPTVEKLRALLLDAARSLTGNPKDQKLHLAIRHTYLDPAETQEQAAERLGLPFNTYRYRLARGTERITERLWHRELGSSH
jgi:DNA-directed RNA polymerase specialized sigma24 family protein